MDPIVKTITDKLYGDPLEEAADEVQRLVAGPPRPPMKVVSSRYPSTYARDLVREDAVADTSRGEAGQIIRSIADAMHVPQDELFKKLADRYIERHGLVW